MSQVLKEVANINLNSTISKVKKQKQTKGKKKSTNT